MNPDNVLARQIDMAGDYLSSHWQLARKSAQTLSIPLSRISQILIGGCGDSHHAALGLGFAFGVFTGLKVSAMEAMNLARYAPSMSGEDHSSTLVIGISNSGEVARTVEALEIWQAEGAQTLAFTSNMHSTLARVAHHPLVLPPADIPHGPGLLSYLGSLLLGYAFLVESSLSNASARIVDLIDQMPTLLHRWVPAQVVQGNQFADEVPDGGAVFLGSGTAKGSAYFGAAKVIEAAGERCWAQDVEEWAHLEYFCEPAQMPTILLGTEGGRSASREAEVQEAMDAIGRKSLASVWTGGPDWTALEREALSPLALWAVSCAYASRRADLLGENPFRGFGGGRDRIEGGGVSRIRSSQRLQFDSLDNKRDRAEP